MKTELSRSLETYSESGTYMKKLLSMFNGFQNTINVIKNSFLGRTLGSIWNKYTGAGLTGAERAMQQYTTSERESAQDFEERMSNTAFQRQVADMQKAGLNPALLYGSGANGASTPSSSGASSPGFSPTSMSDLIQLLSLKPLLKKTEAETDKIRADSALTRQKAKTEEVETSLRSLIRDMYPDLTNSQINDYLASADLKVYQGAREKAEEELTWAKKEFQDKENESYKELLELRKALMSAQEGRELSEKELNEARAWLTRIEAKYEKDTGLKMSSNEYLGLGLAIAKIFGVDPSDITTALKKIRGSE